MTELVESSVDWSLEGAHARAHAGKAPKAVGDQLHAIAIGLLNNATVFIERGL
jgi:hypothetical protein